MSIAFQIVKCYKLSRSYSLFRSPNKFKPYIYRLFEKNLSDTTRKFVNFDEVMAQRRIEARRSVVVQVNSEFSFDDLYCYCSKYSEINGIHHYKNAGGEHFMLIEFRSEENLKDVMHNCNSHQKDLDVMASQSPFMWFRAVSGKKVALTKSSTKSLITTEGIMSINEEILLEKMLKCDTVSNQIQLLYDHTVLNDLGIRLRFMVARQLESIFESIYANVVVQPFGSSVNGFGKIGCDLDLVLTNVVTEQMSDSSKRLVYQEKKCDSGRSPWQRHMELIGELLELRVAGATRVQRILHARVPIVKYAHEYTDVECDLCCNNMSGVYMSELLWLLSSLDPRVRPLVFTVRYWAKAVGLTNRHPGRWITNFPLTLMVLFFLQQKTKDGIIIPSLKCLVRKSSKEDVRIAENNLNCTFLRDLNKLPDNCYGHSSSNLQTLLLQFFEFYAQFDFQDYAISINEGVAIRKPNDLPLYIVNPLEQALNVSRNVSYEECERLKLEIRNAAWQLEAMLERDKVEDWGILCLIENKSTRGLKKLLKVGNSHRLITVKDLFADNEPKIPGEGIRNKLKRLTGKSDEVLTKEDNLIKKEEQNKRLKFKNNRIKSQVFRIQRDKM